MELKLTIYLEKDDGGVIMCEFVLAGYLFFGYLMCGTGDAAAVTTTSSMLAQVYLFLEYVRE